MPRLDEIKLDPMYLTPREKEIVDRQLAEEQGTDLDEPIAEYVKQVNQFPFIATVRSCSGHGYPGHLSFRFTREWHEKFINEGIKLLIQKRVCKIYLEVGDWLPTDTGIVFRWNATFAEQNRDAFFHEFLHWLSQSPDPIKA